MIEAGLLLTAIASIIYLLRNTSRYTEDSDELLGLFAYKDNKEDAVLKRSKEHRRNA